MLTKKQARILRYLIAQESVEVCLLFKDSRCLARGLFSCRSYEEALAQFRKIKHRDPDTELPAELRDRARLSELHELERRPPRRAESAAHPHLSVPRVRPTRGRE